MHDEDKATAISHNHFVGSRLQTFCITSATPAASSARFPFPRSLFICIKYPRKIGHDVSQRAFHLCLRRLRVYTSMQNPNSAFQLPLLCFAVCTTSTHSSSCVVLAKNAIAHGNDARRAAVADEIIICFIHIAEYAFGGEGGGYDGEDSIRVPSAICFNVKVYLETIHF